MSGAVKGIKKVFKSVGHALKKLWNNKIVRAIIIAVAIYFTAGLAYGAFAATAASEAGAAAGAMGSLTAAEVTAGTAGIAEGEAVGSVLASSGGATAATAGAEVGAAAGLADGAIAGEAGGGVLGAVDGAVGTGASAVAESSAPGLVDGALQGATGAAPEAASTAGQLSATELAPMETLAPSAPTVAPLEAPVLTAPTTNPGIINGTMDWFKGLSSGEKLLVGQGLSGAVKGGFEMYGANQQAEAREQARQDAIRRGKVPDITSYFSRFTPGSGGLVNGNVG